MSELLQLGKKQENGKRTVLRVILNDGSDELYCKSFNQLIGSLEHWIRVDGDGCISKYLELHKDDKITITVEELDEQDFLDMFYERD